MRTVPFYRQVADTIRARIVDGQYKVGDCLPASAELEKAFNVSNITMRKALALLREEGWLKTKRGVGTVVVKQQHDNVIDIRQSGSFSDWLGWASGRDHAVRQNVLGIEQERGPEYIRQLLGVTADDNIWRMRRLRSKDGEPISYHVSYGRLENRRLIRKKDFQGSGSMIEVLQQNSPVKICRIDQHVEAAVADMDLAEILNISFGNPIFIMENVYVNARDAVTAITQVFLRADRYRYSTSIELES